MESVSWHEVLAWVLVFLNVILAIVAWSAKLWWSKEYKAAKEAQIKLLEAQVKQLQDLTPMKLQDYVKASTDMLTKYNNQLEDERRKVQEDLEKSRTQLKEALEKGGLADARISELEEQTKVLTADLNQKGNEIDWYHRYARSFPVRFKDAYGPVGAWFLMQKSRTEPAADQETSVKIISTNKDIAENQHLKCIEEEAWEEFLDRTITQAIIWAKETKK
jgi:hypothetical protein